MTSDNSDGPDGRGHTHGEGLALPAQQLAILQRGISELLELTEGLQFRPLASKNHPLALTNLAYRQVPEPQVIRDNVRARMKADPVSVLEDVLALLELYASNQVVIDEFVQDDAKFVGTSFSSKRCNGWIAFFGAGDREKLVEAIDAQWQFRYFPGPAGPAEAYPLLNMLARYGYTYGHMPYGDVHAMSHFIEDFAPGLIVCTGPMSDLDHTLSLAAMKMGIPAVVPTDYPFALGRSLRADTPEQIAEAVVGFVNIRRLLDTPDVPKLPEYLSREHASEKIDPAVVWGKTDESFFLVRKGRVEKTGVEVVGEPGAAMGITITIDAEPMDAFDRQHIERRASAAASMISGVAGKYSKGKLSIGLAKNAAVSPAQIGEAILAVIRHEMPKLDKIGVRICFDPKQIEQARPAVDDDLKRTEQEIENAHDDTIETFYMCVGCSPFAPDHACVLTPDRPPQCGRGYGSIKAGALYGYDDMSNIHHSKLHRDINSFLPVDKGRCIDEVRGEYEGTNAKAAELTGGRTRRIFLHSLDEHPHTGCACYRLIMFKTDRPRPGIGIMAARYEGACPDGRTWNDLRYALTGKQTPGMAGASPAYLKSPRFLAAHGGWDSVVWVCPKIAGIMGDDLPSGIAVGDDPDSTQESDQ